MAAQSLHAQSGYAKNWSKHCAGHNADCSPVRFVNVNSDGSCERVKAKEYVREKKAKEDTYQGEGHHDD